MRERGRGREEREGERGRGREKEREGGKEREREGGRKEREGERRRGRGGGIHTPAVGHCAPSGPSVCGGGPPAPPYRPAPPGEETKSR